MPITLVFKISHTEDGIMAEPEVKLGDAQCTHELKFAADAANIVTDLAKELSRVINKYKQQSGGNNVH